PVEEAPRCLPPAWCGEHSSFRPFDECRRNLVAHDHDAQNAIVAEQRRGAETGRVNRRVTGPCRGETGRGPAPHRGDQLEHWSGNPRPQCVATGVSGDVPDCTARGVRLEADLFNAAEELVKKSRVAQPLRALWATFSGPRD